MQALAMVRGVIAVVVGVTATALSAVAHLLALVVERAGKHQQEQRNETVHPKTPKQSGS